jgi:hypothetical protein
VHRTKRNLKRGQRRGGGGGGGTGNTLMRTQPTLDPITHLRGRPFFRVVLTTKEGH